MGQVAQLRPLAMATAVHTMAPAGVSAEAVVGFSEIQVANSRAGEEPAEGRAIEYEVAVFGVLTVSDTDDGGHLRDLHALLLRVAVAALAPSGRGEVSTHGSFISLAIRRNNAELSSCDKASSQMTANASA